MLYAKRYGHNPCLAESKYDYFLCPYARCWVGKRHLDSAIETLSGEFEFHVHWKPFLLNPGMPDEGEPLEQHLRKKYGDAAIQRFLSSDSPLKQAGRAVVRTYLAIFKHFNSFTYLGNIVQS